MPASQPKGVDALGRLRDHLLAAVHARRFSVLNAGCCRPNKSMCAEG